MTEAATGANEIAGNVAGVAQAAQDSSSGAATTQGAASSLAQLAEELTRLVAQFTLDEGTPRDRPTATSRRGLANRTTPMRSGTSREGTILRPEGPATV